METNEFQKKCTEVVKEIDKKYNVERDSYLSFAQLMEEIGKLARDINSPKLRNKEIDRYNMEGEFADVMMQLSVLADFYNVDLEKVVEAKMKILRERHNL